jgi:hypothetical protein
MPIILLIFVFALRVRPPSTAAKLYNVINIKCELEDVKGDGVAGGVPTAGASQKPEARADS